MKKIYAFLIHYILKIKCFLIAKFLRILKMFNEYFSQKYALFYNESVFNKLHIFNYLKSEKLLLISESLMKNLDKFIWK